MKILTHVNMAPIESSEVLMRGLQGKQTSMWAFVSIEERIPIEHPLRRIRKAGRSTAGEIVGGV